MPRRRHLDAKLLAGYVPGTVIGLVAIGLLIAGSRSWAAVLAGHVVLAAWGAQVALANLAILALRFQRGFLGRALAISVASTLLIPLVALAGHQLEWMAMGKPDVAGYLLRSTGTRCTVVGGERLRPLRNARAYAAEATIRCAGEEHDRACKWIFWYRQPKKAWSDPPPVHLSCTP